MLSNRTEPRSIATQLVLLFTVCATLLLSCSLGVFYWIVVRHAFEEDNAVLADKVAAIRTAIKQPDGVNELTQDYGDVWNAGNRLMACCRRRGLSSR